MVSGCLFNELLFSIAGDQRKALENRVSHRSVALRVIWVRLSEPGFVMRAGTLAWAYTLHTPLPGSVYQYLILCSVT